MKKLSAPFLAFILLSFFSCKNDKKSQNELKRKEKQLILKENETINQISEEEKLKMVNQNPNIENLIGYWFTPRAAFVNMSFDKNGRFEFNDYNLHTD